MDSGKIKKNWQERYSSISILYCLYFYLMSLCPVEAAFLRQPLLKRYIAIMLYVTGCCYSSHCCCKKYLKNKMKQKNLNVSPASILLTFEIYIAAAFSRMLFVNLPVKNPYLVKASLFIIACSKLGLWVLNKKEFFNMNS